MRLISDYIEREFGIKVTDRRPGLIASVGTSAERVFAKNPNRIMWLIINMSTNTIYQSWEGTVSSSNGVILDPSGGSTGMILDEDLYATGDEVWVIASGASSAIKAIEIVAVK